MGKQTQNKDSAHFPFSSINGVNWKIFTKMVHFKKQSMGVRRSSWLLRPTAEQIEFPRQISNWEIVFFSSAKLGWLHYIRYRPISPLLLMLTGEMCKPVILADAIHLAFIRRLIDRTSNDSSILRDAVILRHYLHHQNQGIITDVSHVHHHVLIAAGLFFKLMFPEAPESGPVPCCSPSQWHGSAIKSEVYTIAGKSAAPQVSILRGKLYTHLQCS